jgi:hypothetical protein
MSDDGLSVLHHVEFVDDIIKILLCVMVTCMPILSQYNGKDSIKIFLLKLDIPMYKLPLCLLTLRT